MTPTALLNDLIFLKSFFNGGVFSLTSYKSMTCSPGVLICWTWRARDVDEVGGLASKNFSWVFNDLGCIEYKPPKLCRSCSSSRSLEDVLRLGWPGELGRRSMRVDCAVEEAL